MLSTCIPDFSGRCAPGYTAGPWASGDVFGAPVPLKVRRYLVAGDRCTWEARPGPAANR